ncbi:MAG: hypothetical protein ACOYWZ_08800 [Bacillota bacterium]
MKEEQIISLLNKGGVVCVGEGEKTTNNKKTGIRGIVVGVKEKKPISEISKQDIIPEKIGNLKSDVIEIGKVVAFQEPQQRKIRPLIGGISIGHKDITAGTLGFFYKDYIVSNNHVLANCNNALKGDNIIQPGIYDGGAEKVAELVCFQPLVFTNSKTCGKTSFVLSLLNKIAEITKSPTRFSARSAIVSNKVDVAIAKPIVPITNKILNIGEIKDEIRQAVIGLKVKKMGRTTGLTIGKIKIINAYVKVEYGDKKAIFKGQIATNAMSKGGDSGSLLLDEENRPVGLLFAGSEYVSFFNPFQDTFDFLVRNI